MNLAAKFALLDAPYRPGIVGYLNDYKVQIVKVKGPFVWHRHDDTDDFFFVMSGRLKIHLRDRDVELEAGEIFVVPRGVEHCPEATEEAHVLLIEPRGTPNTGTAGGAMTAEPIELVANNVQNERPRGAYGRPMPITPHIVVQGAERAVAFYRDAFGAEEIERIPTPDGRLMSVELRIHGGLVHVADEFPEMGVLAPPSIGGTAVVLAVDVEDAEAVFAQAVAAGAKVRQPLADMFWGDRHGQLDDPFGHRWNVGQHLRDVPHDEIVAAAARAFG